MDNFGVFLLFIAIAAFSFFVAAPMVLNAISTFGVQKKFTREMIKENIISEEKVHDMEPKKQLMGVIVALIVMAALIYTSYRIRYGLICMVVGLLSGFIRYRYILQFNNLTVKRFKNTYPNDYDSERLKKYIDKTF